MTGVAHAAPGGDETAELRRCLRDIVSLAALPAIWAEASRRQVADGLAEVLQRMLGADVVYVALRSTEQRPVEQARCTRPGASDAADTIHDAVEEWLRGAAPPALPLPSLAGRTAVVTPIGLYGEHGLLVAASHGPFPSEHERLLLNLAANHAAAALQTVRFRDEQRIATVLQQVGAAVAAELDPERVVQSVTDAVTSATGAAFGAFFRNVVDEHGESYMLYTLSGAPREAFARFAMPRNTAIFAPTFAGEGPLRLDDVTKDARYGHNPPYRGMPQGHLPVRSYLAVPVKSRGGAVHGGLFLGHPEPGMFGERHERVAVGIAGWAGLALDNAGLYWEAQQANRAKDQFLATLSHELRTPLNAIMGWLSMLRQPNMVPPERVPKAYDALQRNTQTLAQLVEDLLDVSRIAAGKLRLAMEDVDLREVVSDGARAIQPTVDDKGLRLELDVPMTACRIRGDKARLHQVLSNLLTNAVKFTARGGCIGVRLTRDEREATLSVRDSGIGIHPDFMPRLFERFQQGLPHSDSPGGLGLGLAIVRNIVELHGGRVTAQSDGIGRGATFTVRLPLA